MEEYTTLFTPITDDEKKKLDADKRQANELINQTVELAKACLGTDQFHKYRKGLESAEAKMIKVMLDYNRRYLSEGGNPHTYAMQICAYLVTLDKLRGLLDRVEIDSKKAGSK